MSNFYTDVIQKSPHFTSVNRVSDIALLEPVTLALAQAIIAQAKERGVNYMIFETYRSQERQLQLFNQGASKLKNVGVHHYGLACDIVLNHNGEPNWDSSFKLLGELAHANKLIWGGDWGTPDQKHTFLDNDHVQRIRVGRQAALFAGTWYPANDYNPYTDI